MKTEHNFRSDEEYYFDKWCLELKRYGFITKYVYEGVTFDLYPKQTIGWRTIRPMTYTPDFCIEWKVIPPFVQDAAERKKKGVIFHNKGISYIDVKGGGFSGKYNNSDISFPIIQKILLADQWIWIDKFVVSNKKGSGFDKTFTPAEYLLTPTGKEKLLHYVPKTIWDIKKS